VAGGGHGVGGHGHGRVSDFTLGSYFFGGPALGNADDLAAIPYSYRVTG
jgi:hypothetical protein